MENATKALLIAAAVLIVILVIALGMKIFNSSSGTATDATKMGKTVSDKTESGTAQVTSALGEATANINGDNKEVINFNKNWYGYVGTNKDKSTVTELLRNIATNNSTNPSRTIYISFISDGTTRGAISSPTTINNIINDKSSFTNKSSFTVSTLCDGNGYINLFRIY